MPSWLHIRHTGHGDVLLGQCEAPDLEAARAILRPPSRPPEPSWLKGPKKPPLVFEYVVSAASYAIGMPKALPEGRCTSCGHREAEPGRVQCTVCWGAHRREVDLQRRRAYG